MKKIALIGAGIFAVLCVIFVVVSTLTKTPSPAVPSTTPTVAIPQQRDIKGAVRTKLATILPYTTDEYRIEYFHRSGVIMVTIFPGDKERAYKNAVEWLQKNGIEDPEGNPSVRFQL